MAKDIAVFFSGTNGNLVISKRNGKKLVPGIFHLLNLMTLPAGRKFLVQRIFELHQDVRSGTCLLFN